MHSRIIRKISFALLLSMLFSLSLPALSYAASLIKIAYNQTSGQISGAIYTDQSSASLSMTNTAGTEDISSALGPVQTLYNGLHYFEINGAIGAGKSPTKVTVVDGVNSENLIPTVTEDTYSFKKEEVLPAPETDGFWLDADFVNRTYTLYLNWKPVKVPYLETYNIYLDGEKLTSTTHNYITVPGIPINSTQDFSVTAVDQTGQESDLSKWNPIYIPDMFTSVTIHTDGKPVGYAMQPNEAIVSFTPSFSSGQNGRLFLSMPNYKVSPTIKAEDLELVKQDGTIIPISFEQDIDDYYFMLNVDGDIEAGQSYDLRISSSSASGLIQMPVKNRLASVSIGLISRDYTKRDEYSAQVAVGDMTAPAKPTGLKYYEGDGTITATWNRSPEPDLAGYNVYLDGVLLTATPTTATSYTFTGLTNGKTYHVNVAAVDKVGNRSLQAYVYPTPKANTNNNGGNGGGGGGGSFPVSPSSPAEPANDQPTMTVVDACIPNNDQGKIKVTIDSGDHQALLSASAEALKPDCVLNLTADGLNAEIPGSVLAKLQSLVAADDLKDAQVSFSYEKLSSEEAQALIADSEKFEKNTRLKLAGDVYDFTLSIITKDGKEQKLSVFDQPIVLKLKTTVGANGKLLGMYSIGDDGKLEYLGGQSDSGYMTANLQHFSRYAVLEYKKSFDDVSSTHWAADAISQMAAAHVITGVSDSLFAPSKQVTRAEFAAFLSRKLHLQAKGSSPFSDVRAGAWYAAEVTAAAEAGIVDGRTATTFSPNAVVTRQEMTVMLIKAYQLSTGTTVTTADGADFKDNSAIGAWAKPYVNAAFKLGFIQGRGDGLFVPQGTATRAEAAQIIAKL